MRIFFRQIIGLLFAVTFSFCFDRLLADDRPPLTLSSNTCGWVASLTTLGLCGIKDQDLPQDSFLHYSHKLDAWSLNDIGEFLQSSSRLKIVGLTDVDSTSLCNLIVHLGLTVVCHQVAYTQGGHFIVIVGSQSRDGIEVYDYPLKFFITSKKFSSNSNFLDLSGHYLVVIRDGSSSEEINSSLTKLPEKVRDARAADIITNTAIPTFKVTELAESPTNPDLIEGTVQINNPTTTLLENIHFTGSCSCFLGGSGDEVIKPGATGQQIIRFNSKNFDRMNGNELAISWNQAGRLAMSKLTVNPALLSVAIHGIQVTTNIVTVSQGGFGEIEGKLSPKGIAPEFRVNSDDPSEITVGKVTINKLGEFQIDLIPTQAFFYSQNKHVITIVSKNNVPLASVVAMPMPRL
jgi:hypothetical protein